MWSPTITHIQINGFKQMDGTDAEKDHMDVKRNREA